MRKAYVVMGATGEYSDREEWPVVAFYDLKKAEELVVKATQRAAELYKETESKYKYPEFGSNKYDRGMRCDYTGTTYYIMDVKIRE